MLHGTTVATNIALEHKGAEVGLITTEGFRDILHIARHKKPHNFSLQQELPWQSRPLVRRRHRLTVQANGSPRPRARSSCPWTRLRCASAHGRCGKRESTPSPSACCMPTSTRLMSSASSRSFRRNVPTRTSRSPARCCPSTGNSSASRQPVSTPMWAHGSRAMSAGCSRAYAMLVFRAAFASCSPRAA